jgi:hypothetical protein
MRSIVGQALVAAALAAGGSACAGNPAPVPVEAAGQDVAALTGRWEGSYDSGETGRSGSIVFTLAAGRDTAAGDVLMVPAGTNLPLRRAGEAPGRVGPAAPDAQVLTIRFVRLDGARVSGILEPYRAPECDCALTTTFAGTLEGDRIRGSFTTTGRTARTTHGEWEVRRRR